MKKITALLAALALILGLCACSAKNELATWLEQYDLGVRYLSEGNYREAIIAFTSAIEIDPKQAPAYVGRGDANMGLALHEEAIADYQAAIERQAEAEYFVRLSDGYLAKGDIDSAIEALENGYTTTEDPTLPKRIDSIKHISTFRGGIFAWDENLNTPIPDAVITLRNAETGAVVLSYRTNAAGMYNGYALAGEYEFFAHAEGYLPVSLYQTIERDETVSVEDIYLLSEEDEGTGAIRGTIYDAVTEEPLGGVEVRAVANWNRQDSDNEEVIQVISDGEGNYVIPEQPVGYYTIFAVYDEYVTARVNGVVSNQHEVNWDIMMDPMHTHDWTPANYQAPAICSTCGEVNNEEEPITPDFEIYGIATNMQVGVHYDYETICSHNSLIRTVGDLVCTDYNIVQSDDTHEAKDGYEWRIATFQIIFSDTNAKLYGWYYTADIDDYYSLRLNDPTKYNVDEYSFLVNYYGENMECLVRYEVLRNDVMGDRYIFDFRVGFQVPVGYDGCVVVVRNADTAYDYSNGYLYEVYDPIAFHLFRLA